MAGNSSLISRLLLDEQVEFQYDASFTGNQALRGGDDDAGSGGAIAVGPEGDVLFSDVTIFTENVANSGGRGGAMENLGSVVFEKASYFTNNEAKGEWQRLAAIMTACARISCLRQMSCGFPRGEPISPPPGIH